MIYSHHQAKSVGAILFLALALFASNVWAAAITSNASGGGNWSAPATWAGGVVPTAADDVTIANPDTVTIDTAAVALSITVGQGTAGILQWDPTTARTLTVGGSVNIAVNGTFQSAATGTITAHVLSVGGNMVNDGTLNFSTNGNTAGAQITFTGATSTTWTGNGNRNLRAVSLNKGTTSASSVEFFPGTGTFTVQGANALGFLSITNGTFKISGSNVFINPVFSSVTYTIPSSGGIWLNNANATIAGQNGSPTNNGLLRLTAGIYNIGTIGTNVMGAGTGAFFTIEGGTMNAAGRLTSANAVTYTESGGSVNICTAGGCTTSPSFGFTSALPTNLMNLSGGTINMVNSNGLTTADYNQLGAINYTGGTLNIGTSGTATNFVFRAQGNMPAVVIDNTTNAKTLTLSSTAYAYGNVTIQTGTTLNLNNAILNELGATFTNNGALTGTFASGFTTSRLQFAGAVAQTYTGTGTAGSAVDPLFAFAFINRGAGVTIDPAATPIYVARVLAFSGALSNAAKLNVVVYTTNLMVIQRGGIAQLPPGTLDVAPTFPAGSAGLVLVYSQASTAITTGVEVPAARTLQSMQIIDSNGVILAGGPATVTGTGVAPQTFGLFLSNGLLNTTSANLLTVDVGGAIANGSGASYVNGPLARVLPASLASGTSFLFPVGKSNYKGFSLVNPTTNAGGTVTVAVESFDADSGGTNGAGLDAINHNRYWNAQITAGAANFINTNVSVIELNSAGNALGQSATQAGAYASVGGTLAPASVLSTASPTSLGYFALGRLTGTATFAGGTYTIGASGTYPSLTAALAALGNTIITGPILYSLKPDYSAAGETFPIVVPANGGSNASNTITIKPAAGASPSISGSSASSILQLNGADYVTVDGSNTVGGTTRDLTIQNTNTATLSAAVWIASLGINAGGTFDAVKNVHISAGLGGSTVSIFGIFAGGATVGTNGDDNDNLTIQNNVIDTAYEGIAARGVTLLNGQLEGLNINNNVIGSANAANYVTFRGIEVVDAAAPLITQNEIIGATISTISGNVAGIELGSTVYYAQVTRNKIHDVVNSNPGQWGAYGLYDSTTANNFSNALFNNFIWGISNYGYTSPSFTAVGIRYIGGAGGKIYYNSVNMTGAQTLATGVSAAFAADSASSSGLDVRDNVFVNQITGGVKQYSTYIASQTSFGTSALTGFGTINNNDYYSSGAGSLSGFLNFYGVDMPSLTTFRAATQNDLNSVTGNPQFISNSDLHINPSIPTVVESAGTPIAGITIDIDGETRNATTPDIGADEGNFTALVPNDMAATAFIDPVNGGGKLASTPFSPQAAFTDTGTAAQTNVTVRYRIINASAVEVYNNTQVISSIASGATVTVTFASTSLVAGTYTMKAKAELVGDQVPANDEITGTFTVEAPLNGAYTVGAAGSYTTLTQAVNKLNSLGITGPVTLTLLDNSNTTLPAPENTGEVFPITINAVPGASATNTITIKPAAGVTPTVTGSSATALIVLNGSDYVTIDGSNSGTTTRDLTMTNTNTGSSSAVIWMQTTTLGKAATNNTIKNVNAVGTSTTAAPATLIGIGSGSSTIGITSFGTGNINNSFRNCSVSKTSYGIYSGGASAANKNSGTVITQNVLGGTAANTLVTGGILVNFDDGVQITDNNVGNVIKSNGTIGNTGTAFGIALGAVPTNQTTFTGNDVTNAAVRRNKVGVVQQLVAGGYSAFGIVVNSVTSGTTIVANNMISGVMEASTSPDIGAGILAGGGAGSTTQIYYNSVSMTASRNAASFPSYALAIGGSNPIVDVKDNILLNTQTSTSSGKSYAIGLAYSSPYTTLTSDYNDLFVTGTNGFIGQTGGLGTTGTDAVTLANWRTATGADAHSVSGDPLFASPTDLHVTSITSPVLNIGTPIGSVTVDIDNEPRSATAPDIGADELPPIQEYRLRYFGSTASSGNGADSNDYDGDGQSNLAEFAFGTDPTVPNAAPASFSGSNMVVAGFPTTYIQQTPFAYLALFSRRDDYIAAGLTYTVQFSSDMVNWVSSTDTPTVQADNGSVQAVTVPYPYFISGRKARFFQVVITGPSY